MSLRVKPLYFERDGPVCTRSASNFCQLLHTCYVGQMMIPCQVSTIFEFSCSGFQIQGHLAQNKSLNAWKIANEVRQGWNFSMWLWMVHIECKKYWVEISLEKWNAFETHEFSPETHVLWKRWYSLYTKCIQFLP